MVKENLRRSSLRSEHHWIWRKGFISISMISSRPGSKKKICSLGLSNLINMSRSFLMSTKKSRWFHLPNSNRTMIKCIKQLKNWKPKLNKWLKVNLHPKSQVSETLIHYRCQETNSVRWPPSKRKASLISKRWTNKCQSNRWLKMRLKRRMRQNQFKIIVKAT